MTGYPSIDKPWQKYYSQKQKNMTAPKGSMFDYLYEHNAMYPNDIAMEYYGRKFSYQELFRQIDKCCRNLSSLGIKKGDVVTVQAIPLPQVIVLIYALTKIGACGNMLYPDAKANDVVSSMEKTHSCLLIAVDVLLSAYEEDLPDFFTAPIILLNVADQMSLILGLVARKKTSYKKKNHRLQTIRWCDFIRGDGLPYEENHEGVLPAFMLRTGGTTGIPKEVVLDSKGFNTVAEAVFYHGISDEYTRQDNTLLLLPPFIAFGISTGIHNPLSIGTKLIISLDISPNAITHLVTKYKPHYISAGVVQMEQLVNDLEKGKINLSYLKKLWVGCEAMNLAFEERLQSFLQNHGSSAIPLNGYGLTETTAGVIAETMKVHKRGSAGIPFALCNMKVIDTETGEELSYNTPGEVCLSSPGIMQGYYQNQQATDDVIETVDGIRWLHTGDIGVISEDGLLTITGRIKRIVVCKEGNIYHKVFPQLIEDQLAKISGVKEISIVGKPDTVAGNVLVAYVVPEKLEDFEQITKTLKSYCENNLQSFEHPIEYIYKQELPRTLIGKVDFRALEKEAMAENEQKA